MELKTYQGFPCGSVVKSSPAKAGDMGSVPGRGRSHMPSGNSACAPQLLSLCSRALEPQLLLEHTCHNYCSLHTLEKPLQWAAHTPQLESSPLSSQLWKAYAQQRRLSAAKNAFLKKIYQKSEEDQWNQSWFSENIKKMDKCSDKLVKRKNTNWQYQEQSSNPAVQIAQVGKG